MSKTFTVLSTLAVLGTLASCSSSSFSTSSNVSTSGPSARAGLGPEIVEGSTTNLGATSLPVKASGIFAGTGTLALPIGNPRTITFKFTRGNLVVLNATGPISGPLRLNKTTCSFSQSLTGTYRILSGNSTGSYAGTTGHGSYTLNSSGIAPKASDGSCDMGGKAIAAKGLFTILFHGPLEPNEES